MQIFPAEKIVFTKETLYGYTRLSLLSGKPPADIEDKYSIEFCTETWVVVCV